MTRAIVCEPTGCRMGVRHRGILTLEARVDGEGGHSSFADTLPSPLTAIARLAVALDDWGIAHRASGDATMRGMCMNVAMLEGGVAFNIIPKTATLRASVRPPPSHRLDTVRDELAALVRQTTPAATLTFPLANPTFATRDVPGFAKLLGQDAPIELQFWTEAALLAEAGIDAVVFGPGEISAAHAPDESVTIEQLELARRAFARVFQRSHAS
jgi:acetylornithine deacetylase